MNKDQFRRRPRVLHFSIYIPVIIGLVLLLAGYFIYWPAMLALGIVGVIVILGFGLPRWIGMEEREKRAREAAEKDDIKWGFHARDREGAWINYIDKPLVKKTDYAKGKYFYGDWLVIHDGYIIVNPGTSMPKVIDTDVYYHPNQPRTYAWDGCTPKLLFFWLALIGTPDWWQHCEWVQFVDSEGKLVPPPPPDPDPCKGKTFWPLAHHASLVHDALYQYLGHIPITKRVVDQLLCEMLIESGMWPPLAKLYSWATRTFGAGGIPADFAADNSPRYVHGFPFLPLRPPS